MNPVRIMDDYLSEKTIPEIEQALVNIVRDRRLRLDGEDRKRRAVQPR